MMNQQPDQFFRKKLGNLQRQAPADAWSRIENNLHKKNKAFPWLRVAAALVLVGVVTYVIWLQQQKDVHHKAMITQTTSGDTLTVTASTGTNPSTSQETVPAHITPEITAEPHQAIAADIPQKRLTAIQQHTTTEKTIVVKATTQPKVETLITKKSNVASPVTPATAIITVAAAEVKQEESTGFKLVVEAEEVNQKYIKKSVAQATPEEKKASGIRKLLDKANDLNIQDPIGELRQIKNEVLALNLQGKKKEQTK